MCVFVCVGQMKNSCHSTHGPYGESSRHLKNQNETAQKRNTNKRIVWHDCLIVSSSSSSSTPHHCLRFHSFPFNVFFFSFESLWKNILFKNICSKYSRRFHLFTFCRCRRSSSNETITLYDGLVCRISAPNNTTRFSLCYSSSSVMYSSRSIAFHNCRN